MPFDDPIAAYATVAHVQALVPYRDFSAPTSIPNATQVTQYLDETAAELDAILRNKGYVVPVPTGATSTLKLLEGYNAIGAWAAVESAAQASDRRDDARAMWEAAKKMLEDSELELDALARDADLALPRFASAPTPFFSRLQDF
jgi:hypothetical protein